MGRHEKAGRVKKAKGTSKAQDTDKATCGGAVDDENYKCVSKLAREALRDYISVSSGPQSRTSADAGVEMRGTTSGGKSHEYKPSALQRDDSNGPFLSQQSPGLTEIGGVLKTNPKAMDDVVLQLALEQQQAKKQEEEQQIRLLQLLGHLPNSELRNIQSVALRSPSEAQGEAQEQAELKQTQERQMLSAFSRHQANRAQANKEAVTAQASKGEANIANRGGNQDIANALEAMQRMQGGGPPLEDMLLQLLNQRSLPLERVMQMVKQREAQAKNAPQPYGLHTPSLARAPWNMAPSGGKGVGDRFGNVSAQHSDYNKELLRQFQALSSMPQPNHPMQHSNMSAMVHSVHPNVPTERFAQARNAGGGAPAPIVATPTSYDLVPETPRNDELIQRAKYLVHLSQADMSTWRTTRRRFRDEDDDIEEDESLNESKPRSRKKKAKPAT